MERVRPGGVDDGQARDRSDQAELEQFDERLAEGADVAEIAAGDDDPVGDFPVEGLEDAVHDGLLAFEAEGVDAVDQVDAELAWRLAGRAAGVVEIAGDLDGEGAVVEGLGEFAVGDFAGADEDDGPHQAGGGAEHGQRSAGVAGGGAGGPPGADHAGVGEGGGHAVVLEAAGRIDAFVLQEQPARASCRRAAHASACCRMVCPSPMVTICGRVAKGNSSRKRQTPLKSSGLERRGPLGLGTRKRLGGCKRSRS